MTITFESEPMMAGGPPGILPPGHVGTVGPEGPDEHGPHKHVWLALGGSMTPTVNGYLCMRCGLPYWKR